MNPKAAQNYLRTRVLTATPEQLQLMLYDGAIRFCEQARPALEKKDWETTYNMISKAQKIITQLTCTLKHDVHPEMCDRLSALYTYVYRRLTETSVEHTLDSLDDALTILRYQRETWSILMDRLSKQKAATVASRMDIPAPSPRMEASISLQG
jgi:flagellar protein FliS